MTEENNKNVSEIEKDLFVKDFVHYKMLKLDNGKEYKIGFKEISGYADDEIKTGSMKYNQKTGEFSIKQEEANLKMLMASLVEFPLPITATTIKKLSKRVKDQIVELAKEINTINPETEKK